jgi:hypothetical protein
MVIQGKTNQSITGWIKWIIWNEPDTENFNQLREKDDWISMLNEFNEMMNGDKWVMDDDWSSK